MAAFAPLSAAPGASTRWWWHLGGGRRWLPALAACLLLLAGSFGATPVAGDEGLHHAGVVVRHGDGRLTYAYVAFPEETINGIELLRRSGIPLVTVSFGGLGEGVCSLEGEGCGAGECRRRVCQGPRPDDPYWRYFRQEAPGQWRALVLGASATEVRDGDVDGWSWTAKEPQLPAASLADVAAAVGRGEGSEPDAGRVPPPAVRTVYPPGVEPPPEEPGQGWPAYAGAAGVLAAIGAGTLYGIRRRRQAEAAA